MIDLKTPKEIEIMRVGGKILADALWEVLAQVKPGIIEIELDRLAEKGIVARGGEPGFKKVPGYKHTICVSTNEVVVHGIPGSYALEEGDVIGIDCGVFYQGFHTDMCQTLRVKSQISSVRQAQNKKLKTQNDKVDMFLENGERALEEAIKVAKVGNHIGHISKTIQDIVEKEGGYSVVRSLIGHGVGRELHEEPEVPGFLMRPIEKTPKLVVGMTIAIEVIYNMGKSQVMYGNDDGWTISSADGSLSGVFERTVAITEHGPEVLTP